MNVYDNKVKGIEVRTKLSDFDGNVEKWKYNFYEIWRYQMTWSFAYEIRVHELHGGDVELLIIAKPSYKENILSMLEGLDYKNVIVEDISIGEVWYFEYSELESIDFLSMEY